MRLVGHQVTRNLKAMGGEFLITELLRNKIARVE